jgi:signal transduction histidine kinase
MEQAPAISILEVLRSAVRSMERDVADRQISIVRQIDPTAPDMHADESKLRAVVDTLLAEAALGTHDGGRVRICLKHSRGSLMLSIKDQGEGMIEGEWDARLADTSRGPVEGAPLTLIQCKEAVEAMRGNFFANTAATKGSTYYVILPLPDPA